MMSELAKPAHLARNAVVYIRQSTLHQVVSNQESLRLQYAVPESSSLGPRRKALAYASGARNQISLGPPKSQRPTIPSWAPPDSPQQSRTVRSLIGGRAIGTEKG
jgi:hypothetical protein